MPNSSLGRTIQERARILLKALLDYDPGMDSDRFKSILKASLGKKNQQSRRGYDPSQKLTFHVYSLSNQVGRRVEATVYSLAKLPGMLGERELTEEEVKDATRCLEKFEIIEQDVVRGKTERTLTLKYKDKGEILGRFEQKCQDWNAQNEAKSSKDPWTRVRHFVPPEFDLLDQTFFQKRRGGESRILKLPSAAKNWSLITQGSYIERDQQGEALALAEELAKYSGISLLLIRGEPGAGKTALMQWLAYEISSQERIVLQTKKEDLYWLERLCKFSEQIGEQHFYLITDDLFRNASILDELDRNELQFPLTLIGTTRLNEDQQDKLRMRGYRIESLDLELSPSPESQEKERILARICQQDPEAKARLENMTPAEREKLMAAPSMLVLMLQLSEGKPFDLIIADAIKRLPSEKDYPVYQVFGVICSFYQYGIITPPEILPLCLPEYSKKAVCKAVECARHSHLKGLISIIPGVEYGFWLEYGGLTTIHELIAQTAMTVKYPRSSSDNLPYSPNDLEDHLRAVIENAETKKELQKQWLASGLIHLATKGQSNLVRQILNDYSDQIQSLQLGCTITGWYKWSRLYEYMNLLAEHERCINAMLSTKPQTQWEFGHWLSLIKSHSTNLEKQEAIAQTANCLQRYPDDSYVRIKYLELVASDGTKEQMQEAITQTNTWLNANPYHWEFRIQYLALFKWCGTLEQKQEAIVQTSSWIQANQTWLQASLHNWKFCIEYLSLIEQCGKPEHKQEAIAQTVTWLQARIDNVTVQTQYVVIVYSRYLGMVQRCGKPEQKQKAIAQTASWLQHHPEDAWVRQSYIELILQDGTKEQKREAIDQTATWLQQHSEDDWVCPDYLKLVLAYGTSQQKREAVDQTTSRLQDHTPVFIESYLVLILQHGTKAQQQKVIDKTTTWLQHHSEDAWVRPSYLALVLTCGTLQQKKDAIIQMTVWLQAHLSESRILKGCLTIIMHRGKLEQKREAVKETVTWLQRYPNWREELEPQIQAIQGQLGS
jgi:hypothetical protein